MEKKLDTFYCTKCGGSHIQIRAWVDVNTNEFVSDCDDDEIWCEDCDDYTTADTLENLWADFANVPIDEDDRIERDFLGFPAGTEKMDVWHWFDERCPNNLHDDLLYSDKNPV